MSMNRAGSQHRNNTNRNGGNSRQPGSLGGGNSRHAPSAGENRGPRNYLRKGDGSSGGINLDNFTTSQKNINNAILEYLQKQGYNKTADQLNDDLSAHMSGQLQRSFSMDSQSSIQQMGQAFNAGKRDNFFTLWSRHVPITLR